MLPFASKSGSWTPFINAIFTSTSATCVTGLVVYDTFTHWTYFGQIIILLLIQIGGIGFMTIITLFAMLLKRHIGLYERTILMKSAGNMRVSGVLKLIKRIIVGTFIFESLGMVILAICFCPDMGILKGLYYAIFHSVSAFCNAGFDLMGFSSQFSSFTSYSTNIVVNLTLIVLIFMGGIGFLVWSDIIDCKGKFKKFQLHTKVVLLSSVILVALSTLLYYIFEKNKAFNDLSVGNAFLSSLFQAITPRTAGFNIIATNQLSDSSVLLTIMLMLIGGSSGSTAGGIKITTFVVILFGIFAAARNNRELNIGGRRLEPSVLHQALAILTSYLFAIIISSMVICAIEPFSLSDVVFETVSAIGTVGLSMGITAELSLASRIIIMLLMYTGRVGILTLALAFTEKKSNPPIKKPIDKILIG